MSADEIPPPTPDSREKMRRQMMLNANEEAANAKAEVESFKMRINTLERENFHLAGENRFFKDIINRLIRD